MMAISRIRGTLPRADRRFETSLMICYVDNTDSTEKWYYQFAAWLLITPGIRFLRRLESATFPFLLRAMRRPAV